MKKAIFFILFLPLLFLAQSPQLQWAHHLASTSQAIGKTIAVDGFGNVIYACVFNGTIDIDPGTAVSTETSAGLADFLIQKSDASGNILWTYRFGGTYGDEIAELAVDPLGNIYATGFFSSPLMDFDPGSGTYTLAAAAHLPDVFVMKLNANGQFVWAKQIGGATDDRGIGITLDASGNVYTTGWWTSPTVDFDPGPNTYPISSTDPNYFDIYITKFDNTGNFIWAKAFIGNGPEYTLDIEVDGSGNVYTTGHLTGSTTDFDPGPSTYTLSVPNFSAVCFVSKLDASGNFVFANLYGNSTTMSRDMVLDASGAIYFGGVFNSLSDFDPSTNSYTLSPNSNDFDGFVCKLGPAGNLKWAKSIGGVFQDEIFTLDIDGKANLCIAGTFSGTADFDPGSSSFSMTSLSDADGFHTRLDSAGNFLSAFQTGFNVNGSSESPAVVKTDTWGGIYTAGFFSGTVDLDPNVGTYSLSTPGTQINPYFQKLAVCNTASAPVNSSPGLFVCAGSAATLSAIGNGLIHWFALPNSTTSIMTGSVYITPTLSAGSYTYYAEAVTCSLNFVRTALVVTVSPGQTPVLAISGNSVSCGDPVLLTASGADTYSWSTGGSTSSIAVTPTTNTSYTVAGTNTLTGCVGFSSMSVLTASATRPMIVGPSSICPGTQGTLTVNGASSYTWSNNTTGSTTTVSPSVPTIYTVTGYYLQQGCELTNTFSVSQFTVPIISVSSGSVCSGTSFVINPSGAVSHSVTGGQWTVQPSSTSVYTITGSNQQGCVSAVDVTVTVAPAPTIAVSQPTFCFGDQPVFQPSGAASYSYANSGNTWTITGYSIQGCKSNIITQTLFPVSLPTIAATSGSICSGEQFIILPFGAQTYSVTGGSFTVSPGVTTAYSLTGTSIEGCPATNTAVVTVSVVNTPTISASGGKICAGNSFLVAPVGVSQFSVTGGSSTVWPLITTTYSITGSNAGCAASNTAVITVTVMGLPQLAVIGNTVLCVGDQTSLLASGAASYTWNSNNSNNPYIVSPSSGGTFTLTGTDTNGCKQTFLFSIVVHPKPIIFISALDSTICQGESVVLSASGGYQYQWSTGMAGPQLTVSPATTTVYAVNGTDTNACVASTQFTLSVSVCTELSELLHDEEVNIYPNPCSQEFNINSAGPATIQLMNIGGKILCDFKTSGGEKKLKIESVPPGLYLVRIQTENKFVRKKLVVH